MHLPQCQRVRHGLTPCEAVANLKAENARLRRMVKSEAERIFAAHEVLRNLAAKRVDLPELVKAIEYLKETNAATAATAEHCCPQ